jgi:uncharacterized membrane protein
MNQAQPRVRQVGMWSALSTAIVGIIYVSVGALGVLFRPPGGTLLRQVDPYLAILEILIILSALTLVTMMCAVHLCARPEQKAFTLAAISFAIAFATLTSSTHFASLAVARRLDPQADAGLILQLSFESWPTVALCLDLLAWDLFLGLSFVFAARVFAGRTRILMTACGWLCLAGFLGPASGHLKIQFLAIAGYGFVLPVACASAAFHFRDLTGSST